MDDSFSCKLMVETLREAIILLYISLSSFSVSSYQDMTRNMLHHFLDNTHKKVSTTSLFNIYQGYYASLCEDLAKFNKRSSMLLIQTKRCSLELSIMVSKSSTSKSHWYKSQQPQWNILWQEGNVISKDKKAISKRETEMRESVVTENLKQPTNEGTKTQ